MKPKTADNGSITCMNPEKMHIKTTNDLISSQVAQVAGILRYIADSVEFREEMKHVHTCNDCGQPLGCMYRPEWGHPVRWNCPHWKEGAE